MDDAYGVMSGIFNWLNFERLTGRPFPSSTFELRKVLNRLKNRVPSRYIAAFLDMAEYLPDDICCKVDRASMAHSLELRVPFLDKEVFAVASRIPMRHRIAHGTTKYAMRLAARRHIPAAAADKPKLGFPVPIRVWLRQDAYYNKVKEAFSSAPARQFFNTDELISLLDRHKAGKADNSRKIWTVYMFLVWYDVYFGENSAV